MEDMTAGIAALFQTCMKPFSNFVVAVVLDAGSGQVKAGFAGDGNNG